MGSINTGVRSGRDASMPQQSDSSVSSRPLVADQVDMEPPDRLCGISDIRRFFHRNTQPIYFISATPFNLLGMDEWVRNFTFINAIDCFDGQHPNVFVPPEKPHEPFSSIEDINNYLLGHEAVVELVKRRGPGGKAVFLMFDERTEALCHGLGLQVCFPPSELRSRVDDKVETTRIGNRAGVPSVPNVLARVESYKTLCDAASELGTDLVIQTAYGDSGHTTFFVSSEKDFDKHVDEIIEAPEVKIMKRIRCRGSALEACVTRHGTIVGPLMTELVGFGELTPYRGGWCGNELFAGAFSAETREQARRSAIALGEELRHMGYRGYFEIDFLTDLDTGNVYLGECNPRITGASSMTNLACFAHADAPLFLFHLLEWMDIDYELDIDALNARWADRRNIDTWSQLVIKHTRDSVERLTEAPPSGIWQLASPDGARYVRMQTHRRTVQYENRAFFLRISGPGDYRYEGADLGILVSPGRFMDDEFRLKDRARAWIDGMNAHFAAAPSTEAPPQVEPGSFKIL